MLETLKNAWKVKELRNKILFTLLIIVIFRIGSVIPVPYINPDMIKAATSDNSFFSYLSILTGGGLEYGAIFAMSITPYINASIIIQLLCVAIPYLERLSKELAAAEKDRDFFGSKINNPAFVAKAPEKVVEAQRESYKKAVDKIALLESSIADIKSKM